jgi:hypothetical protein
MHRGRRERRDVALGGAPCETLGHEIDGARGRGVRARFTGGCSDDDEKNTCADLRDGSPSSRSTSGTQSFEEVAEQVERTAERDALVAELSAEGCSGS